MTQVAPLQEKKHGGVRDNQLSNGFAADTAAATGQSKATTNRALARADVLGDTTLDKITGTSLDTGVEMDALVKLPEPARAELIERAVAGESVDGFSPCLCVFPSVWRVLKPCGTSVRRISKYSNCRWKIHFFDAVTTKVPTSAEMNPLPRPPTEDRVSVENRV